jgi:hypothetical protein
MNLGHVDARKHVGDAAVPIAITDIPGQPDPIADALTVANGDKIYCKITENPSGVATAAVIEKAAAWPTSTSPVLIGGDEATGENGTRNIRLCEVVTVGGLVKLKIYHTGNIAHFQPELAENTLSPASEGLGGRVLKLWNTLTGQWMFRMISKGLGQNTITEDGDEIEIRGTKRDGDIYVWYGDTEPSTPELTHRDGYFTSGEEVDGDEDPAVDPERFDIKIPEVVAGTGVTVTNTAVNGGTRYEVSADGGGGSIIHQWQTTQATDTTIDVRGGTVTSQDTFAQADVAAVAGLAVAASGYALLTITRNASTRAITDRVISYGTGEPPSSDSTYQYIPLAKVTFAGGVITEIEQRRFEEINIFEDLAVVNGEFMLADLLIASRGIYAPPAP